MTPQNNMFEKLSKIQELNRQKEILLIEERNATQPALTDFTIIPQLYEWFQDAQVESIESEVTKRRQFLFIVLYLYSPKSLLPDGLRGTLVNVLNSVHKSSISNDVHYLYLFYKQYGKFRKNVDKSYAFICDKLRFKFGSYA